MSERQLASEKCSATFKPFAYCQSFADRLRCAYFDPILADWAPLHYPLNRPRYVNEFREWDSVARRITISMSDCNL